MAKDGKYASRKPATTPRRKPAVGMAAPEISSSITPPAIPNSGPADELASIREQMHILKSREAELRTLLLKDPNARSGKRFVVSVRTSVQHRVDADRLRRNHPEVAALVTFEHSVQQLVVSGINEDGEIVPLLRSRPMFGKKRNGAAIRTGSTP